MTSQTHLTGSFVPATQQWLLHGPHWAGPHTLNAPSPFQKASICLVALVFTAHSLSANDWQRTAV